MKSIVVFLIAFFVGAVAAGAATQSVLGKRDANAPVNIAADKMQADLNAKSVTYVGNVIVTQGDIRMHANVMKVATNNGQADKIFADGNVIVDSPASGIATGDNGIYSVGPRTVTLTGHVILKRAKDVMRGSQLTVNLVTGQAQLGAKAAPGTPGLPGGRVQGVFTPPPSGQGSAQ